MTMLGKIWLSFAVLSVLWAAPVTVQAVIYSPTQTDLLALQYVDFINNTAPDHATVHSIIGSEGDGARVSFDTDYDIDDNLWRVATENAGFTHDLTGFDAFNILIGDPVAPAGINLQAQIFVRSANNDVLTASNPQQLGSFPVTLTIPVSRITNQGGDPSDITSFGIEFFGGDEFLGSQNFMATARTAPQPPNLVDHTLYSWEGNLNGWTPGFQPDHAHSLSSTGATLGTSALKVVRTVTGTDFPAGSDNKSFRWGSQINLDANTGATAPNDYNNNAVVDAADYVVWRKGGTLQNETVTPGSATAQDYTVWRQNFGSAAGPNQGVLSQIANIVNLVNDPDAYSVSFDLRIEDQFPRSNPQYAIFALSIGADDGNPTTAGGSFWQAPQIDVDVSQLASAPVQITLDFLLSQFDDLSRNGIQSLKTEGLYAGTQYLSFNVASNFPANVPASFTFFIDNFRIRHIATPGSGAAVPEPGGTYLVVMAAIGALLLKRRQCCTW